MGKKSIYIFGIKIKKKVSAVSALKGKEGKGREPQSELIAHIFGIEKHTQKLNFIQLRIKGDLKRERLIGYRKAH